MSAANGSAPMPALPGNSAGKIGSIRRGDVSAYEEFRIKFSCANAGGGGPAVTSLKNPSASIESATFAQPGQYVSGASQNGIDFQNKPLGMQATGPSSSRLKKRTVMHPSAKLAGVATSATGPGGIASLSNKIELEPLPS